MTDAVASAGGAGTPARQNDTNLAVEDLPALRRLHELYGRLASETDLEAALRDILAAAVELTGTDRGVVQRVSDDGERLEFAVHHGYGEGTRFTEHFRFQGSKIACDAVRAHRRPMIVEDVANHPGFAGTIEGEIAAAEEIRATLSVPMVSRTGELIGVLNTQFRTPHHPSERELQLMEMLAWTAAGFIERHNAGEATLRSSEERYRTLFDSIDEGFYFARALFDDDGRCTDIVYEDENPAAIRLTGRTAKRRRLSELGEYEDYWREIFGAVARTGEARRLEHYAEPDGIWYDFYVFKPPGSRPGAFAVVFRDVTQRKHAERRQAFLLKLSDALRPLTNPAMVRTEACRLLGEHLAADWVVYGQIDLGRDIVDIDRGYSAKGEPPASGEQPLSAFGWTLPSYLAGRTIVVTDTQASDQVPAEERAAIAAIRMIGLISVPLLKDGVLVGALAVSQEQPRSWTQAEVQLVEETADRIWEAVERARAEAAMSLSEERFRTLAETINDVFYMTDLDRGALEYLSPSYERMWGRPAAELQADLAAFRDTIHPDDLAGYEADKAAQARGESVTVEYRIVRPDGSIRWILDRSFPVAGRGGNRSAGVASDVTERKRAEESLRDSQERQAFLLKLSDAMRPLNDPSEIIATAAAAIGTQLGADQVIYAESDFSGEYVTIEREWNNGAIPSNARRHRLDEFGPGFIADLRRGRTTAIADISLDPRTSSSAALATFAQASIQALLNVPLIKDGRLVAVLGAHKHVPHAWRPQDLALLEEVAERTWGAVERARAEAALRASEERLRKALGVDTVGVIFWGADFNIIDVNPAFLAMTGFGQEEAVGMTWQELTPPEFHEASRRAVAELEATDRTTPYEKQYYRKDGSRWWGLFAARRISETEVVEFVLDVSGRRDKEQALRKSEEQLRLIVESARDYAIFTTDPEGRISGWYAGAENVFGWSAEEAVGADVAMTFTAEDREQGQPDQERAIARDKGRAPNVRWHCRKDGSKVFIEGFAVPLRSETGDLTGFLKIGRDVTERRQAQEHERMLLAELQHRVRNTLAVVRSIAIRTAQSSASVDEMSSHLQGRLAAFSRVQAVVTRNPRVGIELASLIEDELLAHAAQEGPRLSVQGDDVRLQVKAAESLSLAIHELTTNAVKYGALSNGSGRVEIGWQVENAAGAQMLRLHWCERNSRSPDDQGHEGFGTELLLRSLPYELDAQTELVFTEDGIRFEMVIPADRVLAANEPG
jgi:PAS domain S-box-containing protein